jgi:hypothetical protein
MLRESDNLSGQRAKRNIWVFDTFSSHSTPGTLYLAHRSSTFHLKLYVTQCSPSRGAGDLWLQSDPHSCFPCVVFPSKNMTPRQRSSEGERGWSVAGVPSWLCL